MSKKKLLLWDADYIAYKHTKDDSLEEAIKKVDEHIEWILEFSKADAYVMFISEGKYFRNDIAFEKKEAKSSYKAKRVNTGQPWVKVIKEYLKSKYGAYSEKLSEADDLVVYWNNKSTSQDLSRILCVDDVVETIIVATDKDVLYNTVGQHINPCKLNKETKEWETIWVETEENDAIKHFWIQMLMGDNTDGITGIPKIGEVKAKKFLDNKPPDLNYPEFVLRKYYQHFGESQGIYEFQKNYRLLKMLETDEDWLREIGYTPTLKNVQFINKQSEDLNFDL
jgi:hypothetical protein